MTAIAFLLINVASVIYCKPSGVFINRNSEYLGYRWEIIFASIIH